jgi:transcription antitermination factor NusG
MKAFMYLAGLGSDTMMYYFPEEIENLPSYEEYEDVTITDGIFAGVNAKVHKKSKEKLNVIVRFEQANIWYTVDIPYSLLKPTNANE